MAFGISDRIKKLFGKAEEFEDVETGPASPFVDSSGKIMTEKDFEKPSPTDLHQGGGAVSQESKNDPAMQTYEDPKGRTMVRDQSGANYPRHKTSG